MKKKFIIINGTIPKDTKIYKEEDARIDSDTTKEKGEDMEPAKLAEVNPNRLNESEYVYFNYLEKIDVKKCEYLDNSERKK